MRFKTVVAVAVLLAGVCKPVKGQRCFRVMSYNVENLFDCRHDSLKQDGEFLPEGEKRWTRSRYWRKLENVSKVVAAVAGDRLPDLIGLCEVENDSVLFDLTRRSSLRVLGYRYVMTASPDVRGIDVALLYQPGSFLLLESREVVVPSVAEGFRSTRNVLYAKGKIMTGDTLHVLVCHLPSRFRQSRAARRHRMLAARTVRSVVDSVCSVTEVPRLIVMGDFNAGMGDEIFHKVLTPALYEPSLSIHSRSDGVRGSYRYRGIWETIDHILVSPALMERDNAFYTKDENRSVAAYPFMYEPEAAYGGVRPFRTYQGPLYKGGYSDHFPVLLDFEWSDAE